MDEQELLKRLRIAFQDESAERLNIITTRLVDLENADDTGRKEVLEDIYREAHSLKGAARAVNLLEIENICQAVESIFGALKTDKIALTTALFDTLHKAIELIENLLASEGADAGPEMEQFIDQLHAIKSGEAVPEMAPVSSAYANSIEKPEDSHGPDDNFHESCCENSPVDDTQARQEVELQIETSPLEKDIVSQPSISDSGQNLKNDVPALSPVPDKQNNEPKISDSDSTKKTSGPDSSVGAQQEKSIKNSFVRMKTDKLDMLLRKAEEMISLKLASEEQYLGIQQIKSAWETILDLLSEEEAGQETVEQFISMNRETLSSLRHGFDDLIKSADRNKRFVSGMVDDLLDSMKDITMLPFTTLTDILPRMVRDIARQQGKDISLKMSGTDIEIDRRILEEMKAPLVHLVRNAIDHGIETKEDRLAQNKPEKGRLNLNIQQREGGKVELLFSDNGRGMDPEKIKHTAVSKGLITQQDADMLTVDQCLDLIFLSGMTTSNIITEISGRGLGMAIVREHIEQLGGSIKLATQKGIGTSFEINLPVSLATFRGVQILVNDHKFMISSNLVDTVVKISSSEVSTIKNKATIPFMNKALPVVDLGTILNLSTSCAADPDEELKIIVLGSGENRIGFMVDDIVCEQEILVKTLGKQLLRVRHIAGATILGSGEIVPVLNARDLVATASQRHSGIAFRAAADQDEEGNAQKSILIAEDSITSRMLLKSILENAGYSVTAAVDGLDALTRLKNNPVDLVVSDVEMPRMNGFELSSQITRDKRLKEIPVVLCTSLASSEDKARGVDSGATAYIVKSNFDQTNLLQVIDRLL